jgi:hypothetical protein
MALICGRCDEIANDGSLEACETQRGAGDGSMEQDFIVPHAQWQPLHLTVDGGPSTFNFAVDRFSWTKVFVFATYGATILDKFVRLKEEFPIPRPRCIVVVVVERSSMSPTYPGTHPRSEPPSCIKETRAMTTTRHSSSAAMSPPPPRFRWAQLLIVDPRIYHTGNTTSFKPSTTPTGLLLQSD